MDGSLMVTVRALCFCSLTWLYDELAAKVSSDKGDT